MAENSKLIYFVLKIVIILKLYKFINCLIITFLSYKIKTCICNKYIIYVSSLLYTFLQKNVQITKCHGH